MSQPQLRPRNPRPLERFVIPQQDNAMTSERKKQLIYECAAEAVMQARIKVRMNCMASDTFRLELDQLLYEAQCNAGRWAVQASEADTRTTKSHTEITGV